MNYLIVRKHGDRNLWWNTSRGWVSIDSAEEMDYFDVDTLLPHFTKHGLQVAAIAEDRTFKGWHLTGAAMIE